MDKTIKHVLNLIETSGFEAYIVGGYVRDMLLNITSTDVDICTNAKPKDLQEIFKDYKYKVGDYGAFRLLNDKFTFDITTYRKELSYEDRRPTEVEYINNLITDLERRDFTINSICMNKDGLFIDLIDGIKDIEAKKIRMFNDVKRRLEEDPLRILRAIRFCSNLEFTLDDDLVSGILEKAFLVKFLSYSRRKSEIDRILLNKNAIYGLELLKHFKLDAYLGISYSRVIYCDDICGMYAQIEFSDEYLFTKEEKVNVVNIKKILDYGKIDSTILFEYGLYISTVAGEILGVNRKDITLIFNELPITTFKDINITVQEIIDVLGIEPSSLIKTIQEDLKSAILDGLIVNENDELKKYILKYKGV